MTERGAKIHSPLRRSCEMHIDPDRFKRRPPRWIRARSGDDQNRAEPARPGQAAVRRKAKARIEDDAQRLCRRRRIGADGEFRIIGKRGLSAHEDRIMRRAQAMDRRARLRARDPATFPGRGRDPPVERGRELQGDERADG